MADGDTGMRVRGSRARNAVLLALSAGFYWSWWDAFHEICRFVAIAMPGAEIRLFLGLGSGYLQCLVKPLGVIVGCTAILALAHYGRWKSWAAHRVSFGRRLMERGFFVSVGLLILQMLVWTIFCFAIAEDRWLEAGALYGMASMLIVPPMVGLALCLRNLDGPWAVGAIAGALCCYGVCSNLVYPLFLQHTPVGTAFVLYLALLVIAFALFTRLSCRFPAPPSSVGGRSVRPPWPLAIHVVIYGCVFGILHILEGLVKTGPYSINIGVFLGCLVATALFLVLFREPRSGRGLWSKMRSTVFPLVIIGYLLIPLAENSNLALSFTEAGGLLYLTIFFFGCRLLMERTFVAAPVIVGWALLLYSGGEAAGVMAAASLGPFIAVGESSYFMLGVVIVVLLTAATFWVATDEQVRKLWGLRREVEPKRYHDLVTRIRVEQLAGQFGLTPREAEVLRLVAQGRRAPEMVEVMGVSMDTVRTHLKHLYTKAGAHSYAEVLAMVEKIDVPESAIKELIAQEK